MTEPNAFTTKIKVGSCRRAQKRDQSFRTASKQRKEEDTRRCSNGSKEDKTTRSGNLKVLRIFRSPTIPLCQKLRGMWVGTMDAPNLEVNWYPRERSILGDQWDKDTLAQHNFLMQKLFLASKNTLWRKTVASLNLGPSQRDPNRENERLRTSFFELINCF